MQCCTSDCNCDEEPVIEELPEIIEEIIVEIIEPEVPEIFVEPEVPQTES